MDKLLQFHSSPIVMVSYQFVSREHEHISSIHHIRASVSDSLHILPIRLQLLDAVSNADL